MDEMDKSQIEQIKNTKKIKAIIKKVYGKDGKYFEGRSFTRNRETYCYVGIEFAKKDYPNECPDVARMAIFIDECKKAFGDDCPQAKASVEYNIREKQYCLFWEIFELL